MEYGFTYMQVHKYIKAPPLLGFAFVRVDLNGRIILDDQVDLVHQFTLHLVSVTELLKWRDDFNCVSTFKIVLQDLVLIYGGAVVLVWCLVHTLLIYGKLANHFQFLLGIAIGQVAFLFVERYSWLTSFEGVGHLSESGHYWGGYSMRHSFLLELIRFAETCFLLWWVEYFVYEFLISLLVSQSSSFFDLAVPDDLYSHRPTHLLVPIVLIRNLLRYVPAVIDTVILLRESILRLKQRNSFAGVVGSVAFFHHLLEVSFP